MKKSVHIEQAKYSGPGNQNLSPFSLVLGHGAAATLQTAIHARQPLQ